MLPYVPINHRQGEHKLCGHCKHLQKETEGISEKEYFSHPHYLDDCISEIENKYFSEKYLVCEKCGNISENFIKDNTDAFSRPEIQKILESNKPQVEKNLLVMHLIDNTHQTLLDLYYYYDFKEDEAKIKIYREKLIVAYEDSFNSDRRMHSATMLIELYRRSGDFQKAIDLIKIVLKDKNIKDKNNLNLSIIKLERKLCKEKNTKREVKHIDNKLEKYLK